MWTWSVDSDSGWLWDEEERWDGGGGEIEVDACTFYSVLIDALQIETQKLEFKDKAAPKIGSLDNAKHVPGGGDKPVSIERERERERERDR